MKWYIKLLRWIWEFPQCLLGIILTKCYDVEYKETFRDIPIYAGSFPGGISLGLYILMGEYNWKANVDSIKEHEWGHTRWSLYLGPLYLIIIGLGSIGWIGLRRMFKWAKSKSYYWWYTERWADKSGGIPKRY